MKLSKRSIQILKNFFNIRESLVIKPGNELYTARKDSVYAWTTVEEEFPVEIAFYNLGAFLSMVDKLEEPELDFQEKLVIIKKGSSRVKFKYASSAATLRFPDMVAFGDKMPPNAISISKFSADDLSNVLRISSTLGFDLVQVVCKSGVAIIKCIRSKDEKGNCFEIGKMKGLESPDFVASVDIRKFALVPDDYALYVVPGKSLFFKGDGMKTNYLLSLEKGLSKFD